VSGGIEILLAVYNGERFLEQQLASLLAQTETGWTLLARDDGSTDRSRGQLEAFRAAHPGKVRLLAAPAGTPASSRTSRRCWSARRLRT